MIFTSPKLLEKSTTTVPLSSMVAGAEVPGSNVKTQVANDQVGKSPLIFSEFWLKDITALLCLASAGSSDLKQVSTNVYYYVTWPETPGGHFSILAALFTDDLNLTSGKKCPSTVPSQLSTFLTEDFLIAIK